MPQMLLLPFWAHYTPGRTGPLSFVLSVTPSSHCLFRKCSGLHSHTRNCSLYQLMVIDPNSMSVCVPVLGCGKEGTVTFWSCSVLYRIAVSASWLRGIPVLFPVTHEAAPLWFRCVVLLLSCEAAGLSRPCSESAPGQVPPQVVLLILLWSCHFLSARLHLHTKKRTLENGPL